MIQSAPEITLAADPADLAAVAELLAQCGLPTDGLDDVADCLILRQDGRVIASAALEIRAQSGLLRSVAVHPGWRGQGWGEALTAAAIARATEQGITRLYLLTETAANFFPRFGFTIIDRADVDPAIQQTVEFTAVCPASAIVMAYILT